jgi:hypothetical protein
MEGYPVEGCDQNTKGQRPTGDGLSVSVTHSSATTSVLWSEKDTHRRGWRPPLAFHSASGERRRRGVVRRSRGTEQRAGPWPGASWGRCRGGGGGEGARRGGCGSCALGLLPCGWVGECGGTRGERADGRTGGRAGGEGAGGVGGRLRSGARDPTEGPPAVCPRPEAPRHLSSGPSPQAETHPRAPDPARLLPRCPLPTAATSSVRRRRPRPTSRSRHCLPALTRWDPALHRERAAASKRAGSALSLSSANFPPGLPSCSCP